MSLDVYLQVPACKVCERGPTTVYDANITHNLGEMADEAGVYKHLWRPEEIGLTKAAELIEPLGFRHAFCKP